MTAEEEWFMNSTEKFKRARATFTGKKIRISGGRGIPTVEGKCVDVVQAPTVQHLDFVLSSGARYGIEIAEISDTTCKGTPTLRGNQSRTIEIVE